MAQGTPTSVVEQQAGGHLPPNAHSRLGPFLCWAVVFADIGTSVYYTPGILFGYKGIGTLAGFFVILTLVAFLLLTLKYAEVSARFPEGGGVVTVASKGINPWAGALGGMFILVDYFLTSAISSLSGLLYLQAIFPSLGASVVLHLGRIAYPAALTLVITLVVVTLLGILNWYGIKESAVVSAVIAVAAFVSDIVILALIFIRVPLHTIGAVFEAMFTGKTLTPLLMLTGFAGAFLAFSGLESISQLSPVMRLPRKTTVSAALAIVVITVGITSPLLTMFSTVLLTDPRFAGVLAVPTYTAQHMGKSFDPNQFISLLAGAYGGRVLEVATAVVASCLLIFASNTAIIGAYHVFLALSRMKFFPEIVEKKNKLRGTPHVSILLATVIPMLVLIAVHGDVSTLGDLYAFGLLGAFSLTCLAMDIIRFRERRAGVHIGARFDPELVGQDGTVHEAPPVAPGPLARLLTRMWDAIVPASSREELIGLRQRAGERMAELHESLAGPLTNFTFYIGFLTTALVMVAWLANLYFKPAATRFGGGITLLGVAIAVAHFQYLKVRGEPVVFLDLPVPVPDSWLVVLSPIGNNSRTVIQAAIESGDGRPLAFLYLAPKPPNEEPPRLFEIRDRFGHDRKAQRALSFAKKEATAHHISAKYFYAVGGAKQVYDYARRIRPDEIVAEEHNAKRITRALPADAGLAISPEYVRYQIVDGVTVAHNVLPELFTKASAARAASQGSGGRSTQHPPTPSTAETSSRERSNRETPGRIPSHGTGDRGPARNTPPEETTGAGGPDGADGAAGADGANGARGAPGTDGTGAAGKAEGTNDRANGSNGASRADTKDNTDKTDKSGSNGSDPSLGRTSTPRDWIEP